MLEQTWQRLLKKVLQWQTLHIPALGGTPHYPPPSEQHMQFESQHMQFESLHMQFESLHMQFESQHANYLEVG